MYRKLMVQEKLHDVYLKMLYTMDTSLQGVVDKSGQSISGQSAVKTW